MGNFVFSVVLLSIVLIFTGVNSYIICSICDEMILLIDEGKVEEACELWAEKKDYIAVFVRDAEIDVVNTEAAGLVSDVPLEDAEVEAGKMRFRDAIIELRNSEKPDFQNIF